jgi:hypothetical protein
MAVTSQNQRTQSDPNLVDGGSTVAAGKFSTLQEQLEEIAVKRSRIGAILEAGARLDPYIGTPTEPLTPVERASLMAEDESLAYEQQQLQVRALFEQTRQRRDIRAQMQERALSGYLSAQQQSEQRAVSQKKKLAGASRAAMAQTMAASSGAARTLAAYTGQRAEGSVLESAEDGRFRTAFQTDQALQDYYARRTASALGMLTSLRKRYGEAAAARDAIGNRLSTAIRFSRIITFVAVIGFGIAGLSDLLSIVDLGWLLSWMMPIVVSVMLMKQRRIDSAAQQLHGAIRDLSAYQDRLYAQQQRQARHPFLAEQPDAVHGISFAPPSAPALSAVSMASWSGFIVESFTVQLIELIPVLDWLPFYTGQVFRRFRAVGIASARARDMLRSFETLALTLTVREQRWLGVWATVVRSNTQTLQRELRIQRTHEEEAVMAGIVNPAPQRAAQQEQRKPVNVRGMITQASPAV